MQVLRSPMDKMNTEEREEGEIQTEYSDISSDEEFILRQRIAEIEATNLELEKLATLSNEVDEKENFSNGKRWTQDVVAITNGGAGKVTRSSSARVSNSNVKKPKPRIPYVKKRRRSRRIRRQSVQLIISDDEFDTYDTLPLNTENLSPDPLPIGDDDEENDEDLELKLRLEALRSKQEIKNDLQVILEQTSTKADSELHPADTVERPPVDEEHELRLIALKSAVVKKHLVRKKKKEAARPYSPTDDALENFDVPSPPLSVQNMDISPLGTPSPLSENNNAVDMEIGNEESQSPIFFACSINTDPSVALSPNASALSRVEIQIDRSTIKTGNSDDEDPDQLRALLLAKIKEVAKQKSMRVESDSISEERQNKQQQPEEQCPKAQRVLSHRHSDSMSTAEVAFNNQTPSILRIRANDSDDEHVLRANLLSKAKRLKRAKSEENVPAIPQSQKPLSEILNEQSKKVMELKTISRTIENNVVITEPAVVPPPPPPSLVSPKPLTPTRNALISQLRPIRVNPVIISLASDGDSSCFEDSEDEEMEVDTTENCNLSPLSIAMDSPLHCSSPLPDKAVPPPEAKEIFDSKLSEFLKKARQSVTKPADAAALDRAPMKKIVTSKRIVKKVVGTVGLSNAIQLGGTPAAVKHLPPSTQLEYNRLIKRMHQLERQKQIKGQRQPAPKNPEAKLASPIQPTSKLTSLVKAKPSPVKAPVAVAGIPKPDLMTLVRRVEVNATVKPTVAPITVLIKNHTKDTNQSHSITLIKSVIPNEKKATVSVIKTTVSSSATLPTTTTAPAGQLPAAAPNRIPGRVTLVERLVSLTEEQKKMLLDVQNRKVVNKRKNLSQSLDTFLTTVRDSMQANRQQVRLELEVRRLRKLLKQKEVLLDAQRKLCNETLHERLHCQQKAMIVARQSLTTTSAQCMEIMQSMQRSGTGEDGDFRLTEEGTTGLGAKFKQYKGEIGAYKDLRDKIRRGVYTLADSREIVEEAAVVVTVAAEKAVESSTKSLCSTEAVAQAATDLPPKIAEDNQGFAVLGVVGGEREKEEEEMDQTTTIKAGVPEYKSPLEHMEYLETANPNGIICPFELNGSCQDEECSYRHLASFTASS